MTCYIAAPAHHNKMAEMNFPDLIREMKLMDIDVKPFFEIAARDILNQHGHRAAIFARSILDLMITDNNSNGIYLWRELIQILTDQDPAQQITLH